VQLTSPHFAVQGYVACLARFSMQADSAVGQRRARGFDCDSVPLIPPNSHHRLHSMHAAPSIVHFCECTCIQHHAPLLVQQFACSMAVPGSVARSAWLSVQADTSIGQHSARGFDCDSSLASHVCTFVHRCNCICAAHDQQLASLGQRGATQVSISQSLASHPTSKWRMLLTDTLHSQFRFLRTH
jgi:hypothetical protein